MTEPGINPSNTHVSTSHKSPPHLSSHALLGSASPMQRDPLGFLLSTRRYGEVVGMRFVFSPAYLLYHPDAVKHVLQEHHFNYNKDLFTYRVVRPVLGDGLFTNDGASWLHQRRLIQPAFHRKRLATYATLMTEATDAMLECWQAREASAGPLDMAEEMMRLTLRIVGQALFSLDLSQETSTVGQAVTTLVKLLGDYVYAPFPPLGIPTSRNRHMHAAIHALDTVVAGIIKERRERESDMGDLLSMLLSARDEETGEGMSDQQARDEVMTLLLAGHETTANALTWTWFLLSEHPEVENRLHAELADVLGGCLPTVEHLPRLTYTAMVLQETLRLYPPVWVLSRKALADDELGGYAIPQGSMVILSPYATHRHPTFWEQPEVFDPERFTPERVAARHHYAYFPFGGGPRLCIGSNFALMEAQLVLATVAQRYRLRLAPGHLVVPEAKLTLRPRSGMPMMVQHIS
ncbi:MAG TPA: cytochrome P450 [Ktedonobacterales bacterium]|nr:cytochrome P450 [Ktedonobacterales bacterium]